MPVAGRPVIPPPDAPGTGSGPRQPPTPPPSGVVEPEPANDQARVKFWRDRALYAEARLAERDRQLQQQGQQILDLSWRAKVAEDWTEWWEQRRHEFPVHSRPSTRTVRQPPSPSTERRSRSRSASTSVTRQQVAVLPLGGTPAVVSNPHGVDEQAEDRSTTWKRKLSRKWRNSKSIFSNPLKISLNR